MLENGHEISINQSNGDNSIITVIFKIQNRFTYLAASIQTLPTPHMAEGERLCQDPLHVILDRLIYLDKWASRSD